MQTLASMSEVDDPVRGAARPDQLGDRRDRPARPLRRRRAAGSPRSPPSPRGCARTFRLATIMRFEADPIGADRRVTGHLGALPAARRRRRAPARHGRGRARRLHRGGGRRARGARAQLDGGPTLSDRGPDPLGGRAAISRAARARRHARGRHRRRLGPARRRRDARGAARARHGRRAEPRLARLARPPERARSSARRPGAACSCTSTAPRCRCAPCTRR